MRILSVYIFGKLTDKPNKSIYVLGKYENSILMVEVYNKNLYSYI